VEPPAPADGGEEVRFSLSTITDRFFEPLVPRPSRPAAAQVDINVALQAPLVPGND